MKKGFVELLERLGLKGKAGRRTFSLEADLHSALVEQAKLEQVPPDELAADLVYTALAKRRSSAELWERWQKLTPREKDVVAFTCLGYTNRQISAKLDLAPDTVSWYIRKVLIRLNLHSKSELKLFFKGWDFSKWGPEATE
jgi:two-component system nitrate/nitrite response regulator NarL